VVCHLDKRKLSADEIWVYDKGKKIVARGRVKVIEYKEKETTSVESNYGEYLKEQEYFYLEGEVKFKTSTLKINASRIEVWGEEKKARAEGGVRISYQDKLWGEAEQAFYEEKPLKIVKLIGSPKIWEEGKFEIKGEQIIYFIEEEKIKIEKEVKGTFITETKNKKEEHQLQTSRMEYYCQDNSPLRAVLRDGVRYESEKRIIEARRLKVFSKGEKIIAEGEIKLWERSLKSEELVVKGNYLEYIKAGQRAKITGNASFSGKDILVRAEEIKVSGEEKTIKGQGKVEIFYKEYQARGDKVCYSDKEEKLVLLGKAKVTRGKEVEVKGKEIIFYLKEKEVKIRGDVFCRLEVKE
jgi:lipopolysaccharide transport protein LptA